MRVDRLPPQWRDRFERVRHGKWWCWEWQGARTSAGYGRVGHSEYVHRLVYTLYVGPIPKDMTLDHLCRTRHCANPAHMEVVKQGTNLRRGTAPAAINARKTHCLRGHELAPVRPDGGRRPRCRPCARARYAERSAA